MQAKFDIGTKNDDRKLGDVVKENALTIWVRLSDGKVIKRHKRKHKVELMISDFDKLKKIMHA